MHYDFDTIIDRKNDPFSFAVKWQEPDYILNALDIKPERDDLICMETADMDFKTAPEIIEDLMQLTSHGIFGYSNITPAYREAVCHWYKTRQNWQFAPEDIYYLPGTHEAIAQCVRRYTQPDEGVIVLTPCYGYHGDVNGNGRKYVMVPLLNDGKGYFTIDFDALENACMDKNNTMLIMCHPHNPTGRVFTPEELRRTASICRKHGVLIVCDEVHSDILRAGQAFEPMMKVCGPEGLITCTAVNKTFNLAGLAMTNVIVCDPKLKDHIASCQVLPSPYGVQAVISAYTKGAEWVDELNCYLDENIEVCLNYIKEHLPKAIVARPEGGYSLNIDFSPYGLSGDEVVERIYRKAGVVLNSGLFFDDPRGKQVHRACLPSPRSVCLSALERIAAAFEGC